MSEQSRRVHNRVSGAGLQRIGQQILEWAAKQNICKCAWGVSLELFEFPQGQLVARCMSCGKMVNVLPCLETNSDDIAEVHE